MSDPSAGYDAIAAEFIRIRSDAGRDVVTDWAATLPSGGTVIDIGCGHGAPITEALVAAGLQVWAIDAAPNMVAAFSARFPDMPVACEPVEQSGFFGRRFDGVVAIGLLFLLPQKTQENVIARVAQVLAPGGRFLFSAPVETGTWEDRMTARRSLSLGQARYHARLTAAGFSDISSHTDSDGTHYYAAERGGYRMPLARAR